MIPFVAGAIQLQASLKAYEHHGEMCRLAKELGFPPPSFPVYEATPVKPVSQDDSSIWLMLMPFVFGAML